MPCAWTSPYSPRERGMEKSHHYDFCYVYSKFSKTAFHCFPGSILTILDHCQEPPIFYRLLCQCEIVHQRIWGQKWMVTLDTHVQNSQMHISVISRLFQRGTWGLVMDCEQWDEASLRKQFGFSIPRSLVPEPPTLLFVPLEHLAEI